MKRLALVLAAAVAMCAFAKPVTMMSYNIRIGCGLKDPFKLLAGDLGHLPQVAEVIRSVKACASTHSSTCFGKTNTRFNTG